MADEQQRQRYIHIYDLLANIIKAKKQSKGMPVGNEAKESTDDEKVKSICGHLDTIRSNLLDDSKPLLNSIIHGYFEDSDKHIRMHRSGKNAKHTRQIHNVVFESRVLLFLIIRLKFVGSGNYEIIPPPLLDPPETRNSVSPERVRAEHFRPKMLQQCSARNLSYLEHCHSHNFDPERFQT